MGRGAVKARVWAAAVVEVQITANRITGVRDAVVGPQIDLLVLDAAPQSLNEHVVPPSTLAIHADRNAVVDECSGEGGAGELRALLRAENLRLAVTGPPLLKRL